MKKRIIPVVVLALVGLAVWYFLPGDDAKASHTIYGNVDIREVQLGFRVGGRLAAMFVLR